MWHGEVLTNAPHIQVDPQKEPLQIKIAGDDQFASEVRPIRKSDQINRRDAHLHDVKVGASEAVDWICASIKPAFASISCGTAPGAVENYIESELDNAVDQQRNEEPLEASDSLQSRNYWSRHQTVHSSHLWLSRLSVYGLSDRLNTQDIGFNIRSI
jgi:hypothetical protein